MSPPVLLDTHAWAWTLTDDRRLSAPARRALLDAPGVFVSPISLYEIGQKVRLGKWPEMAPHLASLARVLGEQGGLVAPLSPAVCLAAASLPWAHRDPFDRLLACTATAMGLALLSADTVFDAAEGLDGTLTRIW